MPVLPASPLIRLHFGHFWRFDGSRLPSGLFRVSFRIDLAAFSGCYLGYAPLPLPICPVAHSLDDTLSTANRPR